MLIVITFFSRVRYFSAFFQKGNYLSAELYTTCFPLFFPSYQSWVPELFCNLYPQAWIPSGLGCPLRNRRCAKLNFSPLFRFFFFRLAEKEGLRLVWKRPFIKRDPREPKNDFPPFPHACLLVTLARIEEVFQRVHCFSHFHHGAIAYTRMAMKSVDHCRLMRRNAGK